MRRYMLAGVAWTNWAFCSLVAFMWSLSGSIPWAATWVALALANLWVAERAVRRRAGPSPRPDYARIAQLERELGLAPPKAAP